MGRDTHPKVATLLLDAYRQMTPAEKALKVADLNCALVALMTAEVRRRYPNASEQEIRLRVAARWLPRDLTIKAFNFDPEERGY